MIEYKELSGKERILANCIIEVIADYEVDFITGNNSQKDWQYYFEKYRSGIIGNQIE